MKEFIGKKIVTNISWIILNNVYSMLMALIASVMVLRYLGPTLYGKVEYVTSIITIIATISEVGLSNIVLYEMKKRPEDSGYIWGSSLCLRIISSLLAYIAVIWLSILEKDSTVSFMIRLQGIALFFKMALLLGEWFLAELNSKTYTVINIISLSIACIVKLVLVFTNQAAEWFAFVPVVESAVLFCIILRYFLTQKKFRLHVSLKYILYLLKQSRFYMFADISVVLYAQMDKVMLSNLLGNYEVGIYTSASYIAMLWQFIPLAIINTARSFLINLKQTNQKVFKEGLQCLILGICLVCGVATVGMGLIGKTVVFILYGTAYAEATKYLVALTIGVLFSMYGCIGSIWIIANEIGQYSAYRTMIGAVLNAVANLVLIPQYGIWGAVIATVLTQIVAAVIITAVYKQTREFIVLTIMALRHPVKIVQQWRNHDSR